MDIFDKNSRQNQVSVLLENFNLYYRNLNQKGKVKFVNRVLNIEKEITIIGIGITITAEMKVILLSYITQLTFGLKDYFLTGYEYVNVYPDSFSLRNNDDVNDGVTYNSKTIAISWKKFAEGHLLVKDGENVFFYQLGIALLQTVKNGYAFDQHFGSYIDNWYKIALKEIQFSDSAFKYVGHEKDLDKIFPKFLEVFFETPFELKKDLPNTFAHLCVLLNQNTLNVSKNYDFELSFFKPENLLFAIPEKVNKTYKYNISHWTYKLPLFSALVLFFFYLHAFPIIIVNFTEIFIITLVFGSGITIFTFNKINKKQIYHNKFEYFLICVFGIVPIPILLVIMLSLLINYNPVTTYHPILEIKKSSDWLVLDLKDKFLDDYAQTRKIYIDRTINLSNIANAKQMKFTIAKGISGFDIITEKEIIIDEHTRY